MDERRWRIVAVASGAAFVAVASGSAVWWAVTGRLPPVFTRGVRQEKPVAAPAPATPAPAERRALDGVPSAQAEPAGYFAVMIDNLSEALPQAGVAVAPLVIEAPVEGGITRLMAVYPADAEVKKIGPVRSARPYYLDWAAEFDALYAHVGGSPEALDILKSSRLRDLNEMHAGASFWRDAARKAPHSTYTSTALLSKALASRPRDGGEVPLAAWKFKDDAPAAERPTDAVSLELGETGKWHVAWAYDATTNLWGRRLGKAPQKDEDGSPVLAKNVVVQFTKVETVDDIGRRRVDTVSGGDALVAADGRVIGAGWKKGKDGRTRFFDAAGNELAFDAGTTWIEVVDADTPVNY